MGRNQFKSIEMGEKKNDIVGSEKQKKIETK